MMIPSEPVAALVRHESGQRNIFQQVNRTMVRFLNKEVILPFEAFKDSPFKLWAIPFWIVMIPIMLPVLALIFAFLQVDKVLDLEYRASQAKRKVGEFLLGPDDE